jgi:hypothetical protein
MFLQISCYEYKYILDKNLFDKTLDKTLKKIEIAYLFLSCDFAVWNFKNL